MDQLWESGKEIRGIWNGDMGGQSLTVSNVHPIPWSEKVSDMNYAIQCVTTNSCDKNDVLARIQKTPPLPDLGTGVRIHEVTS